MSINRISFIFAGALLFLCACKSAKKSTFDIDDIPVVEVRDFVDPTDFFLVPLQTNNLSLMGDIKKVAAGTDKLFILAGKGNISSSSLFVFNKDGTFEAEIGNVGRGPGEYLELEGFDFDEGTRTVHLLDAGLSKVLVYTYSGNFVRELKIDDGNVDPYDIVCLGDRYVFRNKYLDPVNEEISVTDMQGKTIQKYLPRDYAAKYSMVFDGPYYFYKMGKSAYFVPFCDDRIFSIDAGGNLTREGELGTKPYMYPYEATMEEVRQGDKLGIIQDIMVNIRGQYLARTNRGGAVIDIFGDIHKGNAAFRRLTGSVTVPDMTFAMDVVGADEDYFIGQLDAASALESYPEELARYDLYDESNPVLVYFKYLPRAFEQ